MYHGTFLKNIEKNIPFLLMLGTFLIIPGLSPLVIIFYLLFSSKKKPKDIPFKTRQSLGDCVLGPGLGGLGFVMSMWGEILRFFARLRQLLLPLRLAAVF